LAVLILMSPLTPTTLPLMAALTVLCVIARPLARRA